MGLGDYDLENLTQESMRAIVKEAFERGFDLGFRAGREKVGYPQEDWAYPNSSVAKEQIYGHKKKNPQAQG